MTTLLILFAISFGVCLLITPLVRRAAIRIGLIDKPDGRRKMHARPIPVAGGVAVYVSSLLTLGLAIFLHPNWATALISKQSTYWGLLAASLVLAGVGVVDDYCHIRGWKKLFGQLIAVGIVIASGMRIDNIRLLGTDIDLGVVAIPFTAFWLLGAINSLNLIDGLDGLLGSVGLIMCLTIGAMAFLNGQISAACVAMAMAGALLGFLWYNFPPASIFLGDCGSMLVGLVVGALAIQASLKGPATVALAAPLALMVVPILDTSAAIVRRKLTGRSIYTTDRGHLHHVLLRHGLSNRKVLLLVGLLSSVASAGALAGVWMESELLAILSGLAVVVVLVVFRLFGHTEFLLIKERLRAVMMAAVHGHEPGRVRQTKVHLQGSADWNELWNELTIYAEQLGLSAVRLDLNAPAIHEGYHARWERVGRDDDEVPGYWRAEIPLTVERQVVGRLEVTGLRGDESVWQKIAALAKIVEDVELAVAGLTTHAAKVVPPSPSVRDYSFGRV